MKRAGYSGRFSCECGITGEPVEGMRRSVEFLRRVWLEAA